MFYTGVCHVTFGVLLVKQVFQESQKADQLAQHISWVYMDIRQTALPDYTGTMAKESVSGGLTAGQVACDYKLFKCTST